MTNRKTHTTNHNPPPPPPKLFKYQIPRFLLYFKFTLNVILQRPVVSHVLSSTIRARPILQIHELEVFLVEELVAGLAYCDADVWYHVLVEAVAHSRDYRLAEVDLVAL